MHYYTGKKIKCYMKAKHSYRLKG